MATAALRYMWQQLHFGIRGNSCTSVYVATAALRYMWQQLHFCICGSSCTSVYVAAAALPYMWQQLHNQTVANPDPGVTYSGRLHNAALYRSARPDLRMRIRHCYKYLKLCSITKQAPSTRVSSHLQFWVWGMWELQNITTPVRKVTFSLVPSQPRTTKGLAAPYIAPLPSLYITLCEPK